VESKPDGVRLVRLWLKSTLPAGQTVTYAAAWNDDGRRAARPGPALAVRRGDGRLLVLAGAFELLVPAPDKAFEKPIPLKRVPAPILGLRPAGDQAWYGVWSLDGAPYVRAVRTAIEAAGPLWAQVRVRYVFDQGNQSYDVVLRVVRDEPWVDVTERFRLPPAAGGPAADKAAACRMTATFRGRRPAEVLWMPWYVGLGGQSRPAYDLLRLVLDERFRADAPFATLRPRYTILPDATQVLLAPGPGENGPALGVIMTCPGDWVRPYDNSPAVRPLAAAPAAGDAKATAPAQAPAAGVGPSADVAAKTPVPVAAKTEYDGVAVDFPLTEGKRRWALVIAPKDRLASKAEVQGLIRRAADLPLNRVVGDWVLTWQRGRVAPSPHLLTTWDRLRSLRDDLAAAEDTPAAKLLARGLWGDVPADRRLAELLAGRREARAVLDIGPILTQCYQSPDLASPAWAGRLSEAMIEADLAAAGRAPDEGELSTPADAALALLAYVFTDPNYQPGAAGGWEPGDVPFADGMYVIPLYAAAMLPDHPHAGRWAAAALAAMHERLRGAAGPPARPAALAQVLARMRVAQNGRLEDPFRWSEVRPALELLMSLHSPPDPRLGRRDLVPPALLPASSPAASTWHDEVGVLFGLAAAGFRESDPKFAAQCLALYRNYYGSGWSGDLAADLAAAEVGTVADLAPVLWTSRAWPGFGAVLRSRFGTDREAMAAFRCGPSRGPDQMAIHFFGAGMPLALAWHAGPPLRIEQDALYNRISVGDSENMDAPAELLALESTSAADAAVGQMRATVLRKLPRFPHEIAGAAAYPRRTLPSETRWRRYLALVKHAGGPLEDYLVIRDELDSSEPEEFNLWLLARSVRQEGRLFHVEGQLAADAVVFVASPDADRVRIEQWSWPRQDESSMIPRDFAAKAEEGGRGPASLRLLTPSPATPAPPPATWLGGELQKRLRIRGSPGEDYLVVLYPYRRGDPAPEFQVLAGGKGVRVTVGGASEDVYLAVDPPAEAGGQAVVRRAGQTTVILKPTALPPLGKSPAE